MSIARAASRLVAYANGYVFEFSICSILRWENKISDNINTSVISLNFCQNKGRGSVKYMDHSKLTNPGYL